MAGFFGNNSGDLISPVTTDTQIRPLMRMVYVWMTIGLFVTAGVALWVASSPTLINSAKQFFIPAVIGELALVIGLSWGLRRMSPGLAIALFFAYAAVNGFTLSLIFLVYKLGTIQLAFVSTAATFGVMSVVGYTTQLDLSKYRTYFLMALIGLLVAMVVNMF